MEPGEIIMKKELLVLAIRAWRKEGKNPYKVIRRFMILDERYGIDLDFYQKKNFIIKNYVSVSYMF